MMYLCYFCKIPAIGSRDSVHTSFFLSKFEFQSAGVTLKMRSRSSKSCLCPCFGTFKMPFLMFTSILVFRPEGQIWDPVRRDTKIYVRRILNASRISKKSSEFSHEKSELKSYDSVELIFKS